jgi:hypothetical protein
MSKAFPAWAVTLVAVSAVGLAVLPATLFGTAVGAAAWWGTTTTTACTLDDYHYHATADGVVYLIDSSDCGPLEVTSGPYMSTAAATKLGDSLRSGEKYKLKLIGWAGWPNVPRDVVGATDLIPTKEGAQQ